MAAAGSWNTARAIRGAWAGLKQDWWAVPAADRRRWGLILFVGLVLVLLLDLGVVLGGRRLAVSGAFDWEATFIRRMSEIGSFTFFDAMWIDAFGSSAMLLPALVLGFILLARAGRGFEALEVVGTYAGARAVMHLGWALWARPRPEIIQSGLAHPPGSLHAFPSGHVLQVVSVYGFLLYLGLRASDSWLERILAWTLFAGFVALTGLGRVRLGSHWPTDIVASVVLGLPWLITLVLAARFMERRRGLAVGPRLAS